LFLLLLEATHKILTRYCHNPLIQLLTYLNNGKIVIGPHLFAGLAMVGLISTSAALVPFMQKHDWVRNIHIALNVVMMELFCWQAVTGVQIVQKISRAC
jgi:hypothetical protein